jgi:hypothetical protein
LNNPNLWVSGAIGKERRGYTDHNERTQQLKNEVSIDFYEIPLQMTASLMAIVAIIVVKN